MIRNMKKGLPHLMKDGSQNLTGLEAAVLRNLTACKQLFEVTKTSFGPNGMNKLVVNHIEKIFITSDCATIMKEMEVAHPAAKLVVLASKMQEQEIGDGSNFVVCLAGSLLQKAENLIREGLHPSEIVSGYEIAGRHALKLLPELAIETVEEKDMIKKEVLIKGMYSSICAKQYGDAKFLSELIANACLTVLPKNVYNFNVDNVRVAKIMGSNLRTSHVIRGVVVAKDVKGTIKRIDGANIGVFTCSIKPLSTETKGTVLVKNAKELENFHKSEEKEIEELLQSIKDSGVNVLVTGGSIDDIAMHFIEKFGMLVVKLTSKFELRRLCRAVGAKALVALGPVGKKYQGHCKSVYVKEYGLKKVTIFEQAKNDESGIATIVLRASTKNRIDDIEKSVDDGVNCVKAMCKYKPAKFLAGGGGCEIELARQLHAIGAKTPGLEQYSIKAFSEALEIVPRSLAENAGLSSIEIISQLYAAHEKGENKVGVDIENGGIGDVTKDGIIDLLATKEQALKLVLDAVLTILRVDQIIMAKPAGGPKMGQNRGHWDDTD